MSRPLAHVVPLLMLSLMGCAAGGTRANGDPPSDRVVVLLPGVGGDGSGLAGLKAALVESGVTDLRVVSWGKSGPLFVMNFQDRGVHEAAEKELASWLTTWLARRPGCTIDLVGHSAGGGVILGALGRLTGVDAVRNVVLISPSVSPGYDLGPALSRVRGRLHNFYSERDVASLKWRTSTFGTYDNVKTPAAGHMGFTGKALMTAKVEQHPYDPAWEALGNDGSHTGGLAKAFASQFVAPLINAP